MKWINNNLISINSKDSNIYVRLTYKGSELLKESLTEGSNSFNMPQEDEYGYTLISTKNLFDTFKLLITQEFCSRVTEIINPTVLFEIDGKKYKFDLLSSTMSVKLSKTVSGILEKQEHSRKPDENGYYEIFSEEIFELYKYLLYRYPNADINDMIYGNIITYRVYLKEKTLEKVREF